MLISLILSAFISLVAADSLFKSRPDLTVPQWNISSKYADKADQLAEGYYFVTTYSFVTENLEEAVQQPGAYIYTNTGDLVWSSFGYFGGISLNFQAVELHGKPLIYAFEGQFTIRGGHGFGHIKLLDDHYLPYKEIRGGNHQFIDIHEFHTVNQTADSKKTGLVESYSPVQYDLSDFNDGDNRKKWVVDAVLQELDLDTNEVLFEWRSLDHVSPSYSVVNLTSGLAGDAISSLNAWDYFHINSLDKDEHGDYLVSARHTSTIYKIDGKTGEIKWRLSSSNESDLKFVGEKFTFGYQHHARFIEKIDEDTQIISFFDNNAYSPGHSIPESPDPDQISSGKIIKVNSKLKTVELIKQYDPPSDEEISAKSQGSFFSLPNGNKLINWGSSGAITEYNEDGDILLFAKLDSGARGPFAQSYRAFKFPWTGYSPEDIAIASEDGVVYISWNGDTVTKKWEILDKSTGKSIGLFNKTGFETKQKLNIRGDFYVNALDSDGKVLKSSLKGEDLKQAKAFSDYFNWRQLVFSTRS